MPLFKYLDPGIEKPESKTNTTLGPVFTGTGPDSLQVSPGSWARAESSQPRERTHLPYLGKSGGQESSSTWRVAGKAEETLRKEV